MDWRNALDYIPVLGQQKQIAQNIYALANQEQPPPPQGGGAIGRLPLPTGDASGKLPRPTGGSAVGKLPAGDGGGMPIEPIGTSIIQPQVKNYLMQKRNAGMPQPKPGFDMGSDLQEMQNLNSQTPQAMPQKQQMPIPDVQETPEAGANERLNKWLAILGGGMVAGGGGQGAAQMTSNLDAIRSREIETDLNNPKSKESIHARQLAKKMYGDQYEVNPNLTAKQFKEASPVMGELYERTYKQRQDEKADKRYAGEQDFRKQQAGENVRQFNERMAQDKASQDDLRKLNWARFGLAQREASERATERAMRSEGSARGEGRGSGKQSAFDKKKEFEKQAQNAGLNMMKDQVDDYFNTIKKIKPLGKTFNQSEAVEAQAKKAMAINTFKDTYKLGTLDAGLIEHMDRILGDTSYTTDKNIEARKKAVLQELERQNKQLSGAYDNPNYKFQSEPQQDIVTVYRDGQPYDMPSDKAERALKQGFTRSP